MSQSEKEILEMFVTYAKIANAEIESMHRRISKLEGTNLNFSPGLQHQLDAIKTAIERLK